MLTANCPLPAALTSIPETSCPVDIGQIAKMAFQQIQTAPSFSPTTIKTKATWTPLLAASDNTKVVLTPMLSNPIIPKSEILTEGGNDNTTFNGVKSVKGLGQVDMTGVFKSLSKATRLALQALFPYSQIIAGETVLQVYFLTSDNKVLVNTDGSGVPVFGFAVSDPGTEGFNKNTECDFRLGLAGGWADNLEVVPLTDIKVLTFKNPT